jgi:hypothetical protein
MILEIGVLETCAAEEPFASCHIGENAENEENEVSLKVPTLERLKFDLIENKMRGRVTKELR